MGSATDYSCPDCGYHVDHMVSGYDFGEMSHVLAVSCATCRRLHRVLLPGRPSEPAARGIRADAEAGRLPAGVRCPRSAKHAIVVWSDPGPCPRCGATLKRGGHWSIWD